MYLADLNVVIYIGFTGDFEILHQIIQIVRKVGNVDD